MSRRIQEAGFDISFTPMFWAYATGFPKAMNISKAVDKKLGAAWPRLTASRAMPNHDGGYTGEMDGPDPITPEAKALDGAYAGFQPKPAVEVIIVAMRPLQEKIYVDQALANGKGVTWLDSARIPTDDKLGGGSMVSEHKDGTGWDRPWRHDPEMHDAHVARICENVKLAEEMGRFPANLLVSDDVLDDGTPHNKGGSIKDHPGPKTNNVYGEFAKTNDWQGYGDSGGFSRYFSLDKWAETLPFLIVPKASKSEKNKGLEGRTPQKVNDGRLAPLKCVVDRGESQRLNTHPTVKPLRLMSYLITLGSRGGDIVFDPFAGSGTTCIAAKELGRRYIGVEMDLEYVAIAEARLAAHEAPPESGEDIGEVLL
jgi:site-specific DNA-methyltransferase (adenine-specific)